MSGVLLVAVVRFYIAAVKKAKEKLTTTAEEVGSGHVTCNFFCGLSHNIVVPIANVWRNFSASF